MGFRKKNAKRSDNRSSAKVIMGKPASKLTKEEKKILSARMAEIRSENGGKSTVQNTIPYLCMYQDGVCQVSENFFSLTVQFYDANYSIAEFEEQNNIFSKYCDIINLFDNTIKFQLTFENQYKNHLAMTEERLIAGISVTDGGAPDGQELPKLIEKAKENGIKVTEVIGDMAYVSDDNLEVCGKEITLIARTNTAVAAAANGNLEEGFCFNKDAGMLQCPAGELSTRVEKRTAKNGNTYLRYIFSKVKCRKCSQRKNCRVGKSKAKERSYSITQASEKNLERLKFEESEYFQERMKIRHRIEEKNGELKEAHGLRKADSRGLFAMHLQMYFTAFTANVKRIVRLDELAME